MRVDFLPLDGDSHQELRIAPRATTSYGVLLAFVLILFMFFCGGGAGRVVATGAALHCWPKPAADKNKKGKEPEGL